MGKLDILTKNYLSQNEIFADAFNYLIYDGESVIVPEELQELDPTETAVIGEKAQPSPIRKYGIYLNYVRLSIAKTQQ